MADDDLASRILARRAAAGRAAPANRARVTPRHVTQHPSIEERRVMLEIGRSFGLDDRFYLAPQRRAGRGRALSIEAEPLINFSSYDYLALGEHPEVVAAAVAAVERYGAATGATRLVGGEIELYQELEREYAEFLDLPGALSFVSGYLTNLSFLGWVVGPNDLIVHDELVHNSMLRGAQLSGARRLSFRHNDDEHLASLLRTHRASSEVCLVMIEGAYSMDGDVGNLVPILDVARAFEADVYIDEAHSLGVLGPTGRGVRELAGVPSSPDVVVMSSLSKAMAGVGGIVAGDRDLLEAARFQTPGAALYAAGMGPATAASALAALRVLRANPEMPRTLARRARLFTQLLGQQELNTGLAGGTPIVPVITGSSLAAVQLSTNLRRHGIIAHAIMHPVVPEHLARVRFFVNLGHDDDTLATAAGIIGACARNDPPDRS